MARRRVNSRAPGFLTPYQRHNASIVYQEGLRAGVDRRRLISALETGLVESHFSNPTMAQSDQDSAGWRQERSHYGSEAKRRNVRGAARRYFAETKQVPDMRPAEISQAVQRSAFPGRYREVRGDALKLYGWLKGTGGATGSRPKGTHGPAGYSDPGQASSALAALLTQRQKPQIQSAGIAAPSFSAAPDLPEAYQEPVSGGGPVAKDDSLDQVLQAIQQRDLPEFSAARPGYGPKSPGGQLVAAGKRGKLIGHPSDRAGVPTHHKVLGFARRVAGIYGHPITLGTGTNHDQMTVNGNVSDHWAGNALDLPATGSQLIRMGRAALVAAGWSRAKARKVKGGLFNVGGHQIIFNTQEGGDHTNHLHISAP